MEHFRQQECTLVVLISLLMTMHKTYAFLQVLFPHLCHALNSVQREELLSLHNHIRLDISRGRHGLQISNMNKLMWSESLANQAESVIACSRNSLNNEISMMPMANYGKYRYLNVSRILNYWQRERRHFVPQYNECVPWDTCHRYRAMAGADRRRVGCAIKHCPRRNLPSVIALLCLYDGGDIDSFKFKPGPVCTRCSDALPFCESGLCDCRKTCQREDVGYGLLDSSSCTCNCTYGLGPNCDELCRNPELYADYDFCATISTQDCEEGNAEIRKVLEDSCPEQCVCRKHPNQE